MACAHVFPTKDRVCGKFLVMPGPAQIFQCHTSATFDVASDVASDVATLAIGCQQPLSKRSQLQPEVIEMWPNQLPQGKASPAMMQPCQRKFSGSFWGVTVHWWGHPVPVVHSR